MAKFLNSDGLARLVALIKQALSSKKDKDFVVTVTKSGSTYSADKAYAEISAAQTAGKDIVVYYNDERYPVQYFDGETWQFCVVSPVINGAYKVKVFSYDNIDGWAYDVMNIQKGLTIDTTLSSSSTNPVRNNTIYNALQGKQATLTSGTNIKTINNTSLLGSGNITIDDGIAYNGNGAYALENASTVQGALDILDDAVYSKQATLVSGTNIKTINSNSLLGSGDLELDGSDIYYDGAGTGSFSPSSDTIDDCIDALDVAVQSAGGAFLVHLNTNTMLADKTVNEIYNAWSNGKAVFLVTGDEEQDESFYTIPLNAVVENDYAEFIWNSLYGYGYIFSCDASEDADNTEYSKTITHLDTDQIEYTGETGTSITNSDSVGVCLQNLDAAIDDKASISSITCVESPTSGANNVVTVTLSNGTSSSFNVKNGEDGVNLGQVAIADDLETNDSTKVLSAKQGYELKGMIGDGKLETNDLAGTSTWVKAKLASMGWVFGKYLNSSGNETSSASHPEQVATSMIPITYDMTDHKISFYSGTGWGAQYMCFYDANGTRVGRYNQSQADNPVYNVSPAGGLAGVTQMRLSLNMNKIPECWLMDATTGKYLFKGDEYLAEVCKDRIVDEGTLKDAIISQTTGDSTIKVMSQKATTQIQNNVDAIGRRCFGTTAVFNANKTGWISRSEKKYNVSSKPWIDVVCYNVTNGTGGNGLQFFGFCPTKTTSPHSANDYIGFKNNVWSIDFIIRRNGTTVHTTTKAIENFSSSQVVGFRLDFRRKTMLLMKRVSNDGSLWSNTIDLSSYDIDLGECYLYTTFGYCSYVADTYIGWNNKTNMSDFSAFFNEITVGNFKKYVEYTYPSDDIDGSVFRQFTNLMTNWSATQDENGHWVAAIDESSFTTMTHSAPSIPSTHYLYNNWDLQFWIGKIKATNGSLQFQQRYTTIKDVYDLTDNVFLTANNGVYTIASGHTVEVRLLGHINGRGQMMQFLGTCTVEMWDWEVHVAMNSNLTPVNYDGSKIFGGIPFLDDRPELVQEFPLVSSTNYRAQGFMKYSSSKLYARVYDTSTNTYIDKQISNT